MTITIVGLGLMGASLALALRDFDGATLWGVDTDAAAREAALRSGALDAVFEKMPDGTDMTIACLPPESAVGLVRTCVSQLGALFCELCGVKTGVVRQISALLPPETEYIPLHPMAGKETGGYSSADARLFSGAGLIITPPDGKRPRHAPLIERAARYIGFSDISYATPEQHDTLIAYTSHLPHIAASALCLSMPEGLTAAYTGGSFRDGTRVANLDTALWQSLILENRENVLDEIGRLSDSLGAIRNAIEADDSRGLAELLAKAKANKVSLL